MYYWDRIAEFFLDRVGIWKDGQKGPSREGGESGFCSGPVERRAIGEWSVNWNFGIQGPKEQYSYGTLVS